MNMNKKLAKRFKLTEEQIEIYEWLSKQKINTDEGALIFWIKTYPSKRLKEVVEFANARRSAGQEIHNIGGWIHKFLKSNDSVVTDQYEINRKLAKDFSRIKVWKALKIYEKYVKDDVTGDDLSLLMNIEEFQRCLEALYQKSELYN